MNPFHPPPDLARRVEGVIHRRAVAWFTVSGGGYTQALRLVAHFDDGSSQFIKAATSADTAAWLRKERTIYEHLQGNRFLPAYAGFDEGAADEFPLLILEDLSSAVWPPPWTTARIDAVLEALSQIRAATSQAPPDLPKFEEQLDDYASWRHVAQTPEPFLSLGLCTSHWLDAALPALIAAEQAAPLAGNELIHLDVRSDNICFRADGSAVLVDWNWASRGNGIADIAGWLPSLQSEDGPPPESILPDSPEFAALLSGYWAFRAGLPAPAGAPHVRQVQQTQLGTALPWAIRSLGLPAKPI